MRIKQSLARLGRTVAAACHLLLQVGSDIRLGVLYEWRHRHDEWWHRDVQAALPRRLIAMAAYEVAAAVDPRSLFGCDGDGCGRRRGDLDRGARRHRRALTEVAGIPVNDATMPDRAVFGSSSGSPVAVLLGDALLPVRLQAGAGLNQGLRQAASIADALTAPDRTTALHDWERRTLDRLAVWVEQGRSRAHRNNLGVYEPVRPGRTTAPHDDQWSEPRWVSA